MTPSQSHRVAPDRRERKLRDPLAGCRVQAQAGVLVGDVDAVRQGNVIGAASVGTRLVQRVVVELPQAGQGGLPEQSAGIRVHGSEQIHSLDDYLAADDLRLRAMAVSWQNPLVGRPAEPEHAEWR